DVLPVVHHPHVARRRDSEVRLHLQAATNVAVGWGDLVSCLHAGRAILGARAAELCDRAVGHREIGNPDVVVTIDDHGPGPGEAAARERRAGILRAIRPQQGDATVPAILLGHGPYHVIRGRLDPLELHACRHVDQVGHAQQLIAEPIGDPYIALAVDVETAVDDSGLEILDLRWIRGREARHFITGVRDPDPILLIDGEVKWPEERLARLGAVAFADDPTLGPVTLGEIYELALRDTESPHVAARRDDDALHQPELPIEGDTLRRCQRLAVLVEHRNRLASIGGKPRVVPGVHRRAERAAQHAAPDKPGGDR